MTEREFVEMRMMEERQAEMRGWIFVVGLAIATAILGFMAGARWGN